MSILKQKVVSALSGIPNPRVIIVDDEQPDSDTPPLGAWFELKDVLRQVPDVYNRYLEICQEEGYGPDDPLSIEAADQLILPNADADPSIEGAVQTYKSRKHFLASLRDLLTDLGFVVTMHASTPPIDSSAPPFLVLVDFHFEGESYEGQNAERTVSALMHPTFRVPPFVLLMSKQLDKSDWSRWLGIAERTGYFRFNYDFLPKQDLEDSSAYLYFAILNFIRHAAISETYFQQMRTLETKAQEIATTVTRQLFQVTPPEVQMFAQRMQKEGLPLAKVFTDLFVERLALQISGSSQVHEAMATFDRAISSEGLPTADIQEHGYLHKLYSELLHQSVEDPHGVPMFGDVYESNNKFYLVLSQECDIASGEQRKAKIDRILTLEGELKKRIATSQDGPIKAQPFWESGKELSWLWWNLRKPAIIQYTDLMPLREMSIDCYEGNIRQFKKRCRLRFTEAEEIQNAFAFNLARVATDVQPPPVTRLSVKMAWEVDRDKCITGDTLLFYMLSDGHGKHISLAPDSRVASLGSKVESFFTPENTLKLNQFVRVELFTDMLKSMKIFPFALDGELKVLIKNVSTIQGVPPWTGK